MSTSSSIAQDEISHFSAHAEDWWNPSGKFRPLHQINPVRVEYIRDRICMHFQRKIETRRSLAGLHIVDVGCGGGLIAEPLARLGAKVTGLDASSATIAIAKKHAKNSALDIDYKSMSVEELAQGKARFDVIIAMEVAEHVADLDCFMQALQKLLKPGGMLVISTLNRTPKSFLLGIVAAEYILGWVPGGTHQWKKFLRPSELVQKLTGCCLQPDHITGLVFNPLRNEFELSAQDFAVNYMLTASHA